MSDTEEDTPREHNEANQENKLHEKFVKKHLNFSFKLCICIYIFFNSKIKFENQLTV
jgi:hypothetical protein